MVDSLSLFGGSILDGEVGLSVLHMFLTLHLPKLAAGTKPVLFPPSMCFRRSTARAGSQEETWSLGHSPCPSGLSARRDKTGEQLQPRYLAGGEARADMGAR